MDAEHKRLKEEMERRNLQRHLHYDNKRDAHKKLYSRVLAKNLLEGIESATMQLYTDLSMQLLTQTTSEMKFTRKFMVKCMTGSFHKHLAKSTREVSSKLQWTRCVLKPHKTMRRHMLTT